MLFGQLRKAVPRPGGYAACLINAPREDVLAPLRHLSDKGWKMSWKTEFTRGGVKEEAIDCNGVTKELFAR